MLFIDDTFGSFHGTGHLILDAKSSRLAGYKLVLRRDSFSGGGVILGLAEPDAVKASTLKHVRLRVAGDKFFELVIGHYDGDLLIVAVTKLATAEGKT